MTRPPASGARDGQKLHPLISRLFVVRVLHFRQGWCHLFFAPHSPNTLDLAAVVAMQKHTRTRCVGKQRGPGAKHEQK